MSAAFFGGDALSSEIDKRTFLVSFVAPQRRTSIFAGKFFAALIATSAVVILYYLITFVEMEFVYGWGEVPIAFATSFAMAILYAFVALTVAFTFSALMRSTITSNMLSFFTLLLVLPIMSTLLSVAGVNPWLIPTYYSSLITDVFGSVGGFGPPVTLAFSPNFHTGVPVIVGWVTGLLAVSAFVTARRQME